MPVNTKGAIATPCKDFFLVAEAVEGALTQLVREEFAVVFPDVKGFRRYSQEAREQFQEPSSRVSASSQMLMVDFVYRAKKRTLTGFFGCDVDNRDWAPTSLSFSMGCSGNSPLFMKTVLYALSMLGPVRYSECDSRSEYDVWTEEPLTVLEAAALKYISSFSIQRWAHWADKHFGARGPEWSAFMGCTADQLEEAQESFEKAKALVDSVSPRQPWFKADYHANALAQA